MDFHHTNPFEKDFAISQRMTSWKAIQPELDKTVLLCANCHREVHDGWHPHLIDDPDKARTHVDLGDDEYE